MSIPNGVRPKRTALTALSGGKTLLGKSTAGAKYEVNEGDKVSVLVAQLRG